MAKNENHMNGLLKYFGMFKTEELTVVKLSEEITRTSPLHSKLKLSQKNGKILADSIIYKNSDYGTETNNCVLVHTDIETKKKFSFGIIQKFILVGWILTFATVGLMDIF